jgi:hypothetical protein
LVTLSRTGLREGLGFGCFFGIPLCFDQLASVGEGVARDGRACARPVFGLVEEVADEGGVGGIHGDLCE